MEVYILDSNYHDISYGFETKVMRILLAEFHMHHVLDRLDGTSMAIFGVCAPSFSRPRLRRTQKFSCRSLFTSNSFCTVHTGILPSKDISHGCCREHRTSPSSGPEWPPPQLSCFYSLLVIFFFPVLVIAAPFFARSCLQQIPF